MTIEKWIGVASASVLALSMASAWRITPRLAQLDEQRCANANPLRAGSDVYGDPGDIAGLLAQGDNPFLWKGQVPEGPPPVPVDPNATVRQMNPDDTAPKSDVNPEPPPMPPPPPRPAYRLPVSYVGTLKVNSGGQPRQAIFCDTNSGEYVKLEIGGEYRDIKLIEVKANSVVLENSKGKRFVLPVEKGE